jgi:hypothetical protein
MSYNRFALERVGGLEISITEEVKLLTFMGL